MAREWTEILDAAKALHGFDDATQLPGNTRYLLGGLAYTIQELEKDLDYLKSELAEAKDELFHAQCKIRRMEVAA